MINLRNEDPTMSQSQKTLHVVGAILLEGDRVLVARRALHKSAAGLWEFPGGKVESGETSPSALVREIQEELGLTIKPLNTFDISETMVGELVIRLETIVCELASVFHGFSSDHDKFAWVKATDFDGLVWAAPDLPAVKALKNLVDLSALSAGNVTSSTARLK
jgi:8-oxo-dGTP diphosphatase